MILKVVLQLIFNKAVEMGKKSSSLKPLTLVELQEGESGILERLDVPDKVARRLMELGFLPGYTVIAGRSAPSGDPRVFRVDGSEVALRKETAAQICLQSGDADPKQ